MAGDLNQPADRAQAAEIAMLGSTTNSNNSSIAMDPDHQVASRQVQSTIDSWFAEYDNERVRESQKEWGRS